MAPEPVARRQVAPGPRSGAGARDRWHRGRPAVRSDRDVDRRDRCRARRHSPPDPHLAHRRRAVGHASSSSTAWASTPGATTPPAGGSRRRDWSRPRSTIAGSAPRAGAGPTSTRGTTTSTTSRTGSTRAGSTASRRRSTRTRSAASSPPTTSSPTDRSRTSSCCRRRRSAGAARCCARWRACSTAPAPTFAYSQPVGRVEDRPRARSRRSWPTPTRSPCPGRPGALATSSSAPWTA